MMFSMSSRSDANPPAKIINRKGIYQASDAHGNIVADERWQVITLLDGAYQFDNETVRVAPFDEPRSDSATLTLEPDLRLRELTIHGLFGKRESRVCPKLERGEASLCWRHLGDVKEKVVRWNNETEVDFLSPLSNMATVWRSRLQAGQSRSFTCYNLDSVTFEPIRMTQIYTNLGQEAHHTRFGTERLWHYTLDFGGDARYFSHFWCDSDGVIFDFTSSSGYRFVLTAADVNLLD